MKHLLPIAAIFIFLSHIMLTHAAENGERPRIMRDEYPRAFFFRSAEGMAARKGVTYEEWDQNFSRLMGIMGKALDEEVLGRGRRNPEFFSRFKKDHPDQIALLHFNGNARDPRFRAEPFFAGHWIYHPATKITEEIPAKGGEMEIRVADAGLFRTGMGRYQNANDDVGLCVLDAEGKPDWGQSEQVQLISVDKKKNTIRVRRGCYGTRPMAFEAGRAFAAAHVTEGPWGRDNHIMWFYNYSTLCPRDARGRVCADYLLDDLAKWFGPGGELEAFDGLEFDVLNHSRSSSRGMDFDADGRADSGVVDRVNTYGVGVAKFCERLRGRLGEDRLIMADGMNEQSQRAFGHLSGIESEGWPHLRDSEIRDWSGGLNRHFFWDANAHEPSLNYINHKFNEPSGQPGVTRTPKLPFSTHRLVFAAGVFTNSAICYAFAPPRERQDKYAIGIWDELRMGTENRLGWLGCPKGPAIRLAKKSPDLLRGAGTPPGKSILGKFEGEGARFELEGDRIKISSTDPNAAQIRFRLRDLPCDGPDLFLSFTAKGQPMAGYPREIARLMHATLPSFGGALIDAAPTKTGQRLRGGDETPIKEGSGASVRYQRNVNLGGRSCEAYMVHPPYGGTGTGYTFWSKRARLTEKASLKFLTGMGDKAPGRSDGVVFRVEIAEVENGEPGGFTEIFSHSQKESRWESHSVDLGRWAGREVELKFVSDAGPQDNSTTDHSHWGEVRIEASASERSRAARYMSFLNEKDFEAGFYFQGVGKGKSVDLEFDIEGSEPIWISRLSAHAYPDAMTREFEKGLVVANPSERPLTISLEDLYPGAKFRRFKGSKAQDPLTNNGQAVGRSLQLAPKDALFLVRE